jgi:mRNA-degrading endonuclease YafQ of YafQ-DinJ toxin-antitoxin module
VRTFSRTNQFKKDVKRAERRGKDMANLKAMTARLLEGEPPPP